MARAKARGYKQLQYYISPFLHSHGLHLVVGPDRVGKTTYTLQMLGVAAPGGEGDVVRWLSFPKMLPPIDSIWYVDLLRGAQDVHSDLERLGVKGLNVLTQEDIIAGRGSNADAVKGPIATAEVFEGIRRRAGEKLPPIIVIDGISLLIPASKDAQHLAEAEWYRDLHRHYLAGGGCLIGVQTYAKSGKIPGVSGTPGTYATAGSIASLTELGYSRSKKMPNKRMVTITGRKFEGRRFELEFIAPGFLVPLLGADTDRKPEDLQNIGEVARGGEISLVALRLMSSSSGQMFSRKDLVAHCEELKIRYSAVDRWIAACKSTGHVEVVTYGLMRFNVALDKRTLQ